MNQPVLLLAIATLCGSLACRQADPKPAPASSALPSPSHPLPPQVTPWQMGALPQHRALSLPPPCHARGDLKGAVAQRETRILAERSSLGEILVAEGSTIPAWKRQAAAWFSMTSTPPHADSIPWPETTTPLVARAPASGNRLLAISGASSKSPQLWRNGAFETVPGSTPVKVSALRCTMAGCALLSHTDRGSVLWLGQAGEPLTAWRAIKLQSLEGKDGRATHIAAIRRGATGQLSSVVSVREGWDLKFIEVAADAEPEVGPTLRSLYGVLDVLVNKVPLALSYDSEPSPTRCTPNGDGLRVQFVGREPLVLRTARSPRQATLRALRVGTMVSWLGHARCDARQTTAYAVVLDAQGRPVGPITAVAEADQVEIATHGSQVDMWLRRGRTITWARADCVIPANAKTAPN